MQSFTVPESRDCKLSCRRRGRSEQTWLSNSATLNKGNWTLPQESPYLIFKPFRLVYIPQGRKNKQTKTQQMIFLFTFMSFFSLDLGSTVFFFFFLGKKRVQLQSALFFMFCDNEKKKKDSSWKLGFEEFVFPLVECQMMWNFAINWKAISSEKQLLV